MVSGDLITSMLIFVGAVVMGFAIFGTRQVLTLMQGKREAMNWRFLLFMMIFFLLGYVAAGVLALLGKTAIVLILTGVVFLFGAAFVLLVVRLGFSTIREVDAARKSAEEASKAKSLFLANMSHELRTPLNAIIGYSELLLEEADATQHQAFIPDLNKIITAGRHLLDLINNVLDLSKIEAGKMELHIVTFDVAAMLRDVSSAMDALVSKNGNQFKLELGQDLGEMKSDLTKIRQTLFNLLNNATKFTTEGTVTLSASRSRSDGSDWLTFVVRDTGIGMTPEQMSKVFAEFTQADISTTRKYGGTGLGLTISRRFCQMMGGDISVESELGHGASLTIRLPSNAPPAAAALATSSRAGPSTGTLVLVIDDDPAAREVVMRTLSRDGYRVETAASGSEGLRKAAELHPDVITLDVMMPGMDGWAMLSILKADEKLADIPVVMLSIVEEPGMGMALGAADYLVKPVDRDKLLSTLAPYKSSSIDNVILLVEDDTATREMVVRILEKEGWQIEQAANGRIALEAARRKVPLLILLDLMMPEMDGFEFLTEIRRDITLRNVPVIVLTAKELTHDEWRALEGTVQQVVQKGGYNPDELVAKVRELVDSHIRQHSTVV